jgi:hypothetical protein
METETKITVDVLLQRHGRRGSAAVLQLPRQNRPRVCDTVCDTHGSSDDGIEAVQAAKEREGHAHAFARGEVKDGEKMEG